MGASCSWLARRLVNTINEKTIPEEKIHWYCLVAIDRKQKKDVLANKAVKSLIWVFLPAPSNRTMPNAFAESSGDRTQRIAIIAKTSPRIPDSV